MPRGIKPERVAGIVALSYLVLIPVGAVVAYQKLRAIDEDLSVVWNNAFPDHATEREPVISWAGLKRTFQR